MMIRRVGFIPPHIHHLAGQQTKLSILGYIFQCILDRAVLISLQFIGPALDAYGSKVWGLSSAGRAPDLHSGGQEFDPPRLHQASCTARREALAVSSRSEGHEKGKLARSRPNQDGSVAQVVRAHA